LCTAAFELALKKTRGGTAVRHVSSIELPRIALIAIIAMVTLHVVLPLAVVPSPLSNAGGAPVAAGIDRVFASDVPRRRNSDHAVHRIHRADSSWSLSPTRNPMYFGGVLFVFGVALLLGTVMPLLIEVGVFVTLQEGFIRHEERLLNSKC
jgi:protein-S-isoprenylcysteine O-methyltransferase Ste14